MEQSGMNERLAKRNEGGKWILFLSRTSFKSVSGSSEQSEVNPRIGWRPFLERGGMYIRQNL